MGDEYIKREDAENLFKCDLGEKDQRVSRQGFCIDAVLKLEKIPAADVRPVVLCADCQYICHYTDGHLECRLLADLRPIPCTYVTMKETDFCSYGKQRYGLDADMREDSNETPNAD